MSDEKLTYNAVYADGSSGKVTLGKMINKGGASGKIYLVEEKPESVIKIFHNLEKSATNRKKLQAMLLNRPNFQPVDVEGKEFIQIAWPEALLDDERGFCVGYMMPLIDMDKAVSLDHLMQKAIRQKLGLSEKYAYRVFAAYNVASLITSLHKCGHYVIDLKPSNLSVYKQNMLVAVVDCDGFSIKGENTRYPAEFVSEEYIYPEGQNQNNDDMGEEQDKFALAVIIFRLLNNGIHPFSGTPKDKDAHMLTIQERIYEYHYAYGLWPDKYQSPHPYSIHEYFHPKTLELFERAFSKGGKRPSAYEWQEHLWKLMHNLKQCKTCADHAYFTAKGCGLCSVEEKFKKNVNNKKEEKHAGKKIRGIDVKLLSTEKVKEEKLKKLEHQKKLNYIFSGISVGYFSFWIFLYKILEPFRDNIKKIGIGLQVICMILILWGLNKLFKKYSGVFKVLKNKIVVELLQIYVLIFLIVAFVLINEFPHNLFDLAPNL